MFTHTIEIGRPPEEVFAYLDQLDRHPEWQDQLVSVQVETEGPTRTGTRAAETRRVGGREQKMSYEITKHDPPREFSFRGLDGPLRTVGTGRIEALDDGSRSRYTLEFDFEGHGFGKIIRPLALRQARKQIPQDHERLKARLEKGA